MINANVISRVPSQVRRIDAQLDRLQLSALPSTAESGHGVIITEEEYHDPAVTSRIDHLQNLVKSLSTTASSKTPLVQVHKILATLQQANISTSCRTCQQYFAGEERADFGAQAHPTYEHELEWLLLSKATVQAYGQILNTILQQTIPLNDEIWYWDDILDSYRYAGLYSIQTSPLRFWSWSKTIYHDVRARGGALADGWNQFYGLVRQVVRERSVADIQRRVISPLALVRNEARRKQAALKRMRHVNANALGVLLGEGLGNERYVQAYNICLHSVYLTVVSSLPDEGLSTPTDVYMCQKSLHKWKSAAAKTVALMEAVLENANDTELTADKFDDAIATMTQEDPYYELHEESGEATATSLKPADVAERLQNLLEQSLPEYMSSFNALTTQHGRPSRLVRYWLPASILLVSSSTILRIVVNRKEEILTWIREFGSTVIDFWSNWVVEPTKKVIGTIRHDEGSEVSIMSKRSLEVDRASLERMVLDFAIDNPDGAPLNETDIAALRTRVKEGDLSPVLKAYEKDMEKPIVGVIRGNLIRALLIQVQKTKVDVEVAMSGIDSILKSQELLFGYVS